MRCRGCGPSPDPEQDREHNDWCPDNPRRDLATTEQVIRGLLAENERLLNERSTAWFERDKVRYGLLEMLRERNEARDENERLRAENERLRAALENPHRGSTFDSWLDEEGIRDEVEAAAKKENP